MNSERTAKMLEAQMVWPLRPVMTSLNGDQSWIFSFPRPLGQTESDDKYYYHIVMEPWLNGDTIVGNSWLLNIALPQPAEVSTYTALCTVVEEIEAAAHKLAQAHDASRTVDSSKSRIDKKLIDALLFFFHYSDHVHLPTLRLFDKDIPVIASKEAKSLVEKMSHFDNIQLIPNVNSSTTNWRAPELHVNALPPWLTALKCLGHHELNFVGALIWTHTTTDGNEVHESIFESPHGTRLDQGPLDGLISAEPKITNLALMHGLFENHALGLTNTYGAAGGLALWRKIGGAKY